jgi:hypothetical protein
MITIPISSNVTPLEVCTICREGITADNQIQTACNHFFHPDCLTPWLDYRNFCPNCRTNDCLTKRATPNAPHHTNVISNLFDPSRNRPLTDVSSASAPVPFQEMIDVYADQSVEAITVESYQRTVDLIRGSFPSFKDGDIEAKLRNAIHSKHSAALHSLWIDYAETSAYSPRLVNIKRSLQDRYTAEKVLLEEELASLRGSNGAIHGAFREKQNAEQALNDAKKTHLVQLGMSGGNSVNRYSSVPELVHQHTADPQVDQTKENLRQKFAEFEAKKRDYNHLVARVHEIAQFQPGTEKIVGGRLFEVTANLNEPALTFAARNESNRIALFYKELSTAVNPSNKFERYEALHSIVGNYSPFQMTLY